MKKLLFALLIVTICFGCNENPVENNEQPQVIQQEIIEIPVNDDKDYDQIGFDLMESEKIGEVQFDMKVEAIETIIGEAEEKTPFELWGADGFEHQTRIYQNKTLEIDYIKTEDNEIVCNMITILGDNSLRTSRNIGIGDSRDAVLKAYQNEIYEKGNKENLVAGTIYGGLIFIFENDKVTSIFVGAAAE